MCRKAWLGSPKNYDFEVRKLGNDTACGNVSKFIMKQFVFYIHTKFAMKLLISRQKVVNGIATINSLISCELHDFFIHRYLEF